MAKEKPLVLTLDGSESLQSGHLIDLAEGRLAAIRYRSFCSRPACEKLSHAFLTSLRLHEHPAAPGICTVGISYGYAIRYPELAKQYISENERVTRGIREASEDLSNPLDRFLADLCLAWPGGISTAQLDPLGSLHAMTGRIIPAGMSVLPHRDDLREQALGNPTANELRAQFGFNVYLKCPSAGGELLLFLVDVTTEEYQSLRGSNYGVPFEALGKPAFSLTPEQGDAIFFDSLKLHAIAPGDDSRITLSAFIGMPHSSGPLLVWA
jgi:hypothetical protein